MPGTARGRIDRLDGWFDITARGSTHRAEIVGGATTFLTLVYIVFVNPSILSGTADLHGTKLQFDQLLAVTATTGSITAPSTSTWIARPAARSARVRQASQASCCRPL
ncbi:MAG: hypothetical protein M3016_10310 [Actinomycetota bacterium]|nr:hypothetical protein [Actinomycetota bacterium]